MSSRVLTTGQLGDLGPALLKGIPSDLPYDVAKAWNDKEPTLHESVDVMLRSGPAIAPILQAIKDGKLSIEHLMYQYVDPQWELRDIKNLFVAGVNEVEAAFSSVFDGEDKLGLGARWCQRDVVWSIDTPKGKVELTPELLEKLAKLCQEPEWETTPIFHLVPPSVGGQLTTLENFFKWWVGHNIGMEYQPLGMGVLGHDILTQNPFMVGAIQGVHPWTIEPAETRWRWKIGYTVPPNWTYCSEPEQQKRVAEKGLSILSAVEAVLPLSYYAIHRKRRYSVQRLARTSTVDHSPVVVDSRGAELFIHQMDGEFQRWNADKQVGLAIGGLPLEVLD